MDTSMAPIDQCIALDAHARAMSRLLSTTKYLAPEPILRPFPFARYGSTRALMLDFYKAEDGTIRKRTNPATSTYADALCNRIDKSWALIRQQRADENTAILEQDDYTVESPATCAPAKSALEAYQAFKVLYEERRRCRRYPAVTSATGFLDLPAELRNPLYRQWLVSSEPIYICCIPCGKVYSVRPDTWNARTALMRLNQQIRVEASSIHYGENDFRFPDEYAWLALRNFLQAIGPINTSYIRHLTVHTHWLVKPFFADEFHNGNDCGVCNFDMLDEVEVAAAVQECFRLLSKAGNLISLTLLLPAHVNFYHVWPLPSDLPKLRIKLIRSDCVHTHFPERQYHPIIEKTEQLQDGYGNVEVYRVFDTPQSYAKCRGWEYEESECMDPYCEWNH
ncbi:hypothetical protein AC578_5186 [Pseudocercospora eumusae]|uniref:Uncharacterized protein n=1 Tax=Pseudocercospora eumusae TaxID=321146 RepID=A0A139HMN0_9PEZI|nr:hypothetical protein AC578_5186 [Pseudocercospora eumusae]